MYSKCRSSVCIRTVSKAHEPSMCTHTTWCTCGHVCSNSCSSDSVELAPLCNLSGNLYINYQKIPRDDNKAFSGKCSWLALIMRHTLWKLIEKSIRDGAPHTQWHAQIYAFVHLGRETMEATWVKLSSNERRAVQQLQVPVNMRWKEIYQTLSIWC